MIELSLIAEYRPTEGMSIQSDLRPMYPKGTYIRDYIVLYSPHAQRALAPLTIRHTPQSDWASVGLYAVEALIVRPHGSHSEVHPTSVSCRLACCIDVSMLGGHVDIQDGTRRFYPVNVGQDLGVSSLLISLVDVALVVALSILQSARASECVDILPSHDGRFPFASPMDALAFTALTHFVRESVGILGSCVKRTSHSPFACRVLRHSYRMRKCRERADDPELVATRMFDKLSVMSRTGGGSGGGRGTGGRRDGENAVEGWRPPSRVGGGSVGGRDTGGTRSGGRGTGGSRGGEKAVEGW